MFTRRRGRRSFLLGHSDDALAELLGKATATTAHMTVMWAILRLGKEITRER